MSGEHTPREDSSQLTTPLNHNGQTGGSTQSGKAKKKVGFSGDPQVEDTDLEEPTRENLRPEGPPRENSGEASPDAASARPSHSHDELSRTIHRLFGQDYVPKKPRPALRKPAQRTSDPSPPPAEEESSRPHQSGVEAKKRAERLAKSVSGYSTPRSRRSSGDFSASNVDSDNPLIDQSDEDSANDTGDESEEQTSRIRRKSEYAARNLVRRHTQSGFKAAQSPRDDHLQSGQVTPTRDDNDPDDYVPRPKKFQTGVLSSLLKLYGERRGDESAHDSAASTPAMTPQHSPPESESESATPQRRRAGTPGGLSGMLGNRSTSSLTLSSLVGSTTMLASPGSGDIAGEISETLRHERPEKKPTKAKKARAGILGKNKKHQKRADKYRITVHIAEVISRQRYLVKLCRALMMYGAPTHRLEEYLVMTSRVLEIEGQFLYIPGCMIISFDDSATHTAEVKLVRSPQGVDLGKLRDVHDVYKMVVHDRTSVDAGLRQLDEIFKRKIKFRSWLRVPVYGLASACVAPFAFQGRFIDLPIAFLLGCLLGILQLIVSPTNELYANVFEITAALITSFLARAFGSIQDGNLFCFSALAQASIALILPGYMVLCSSLELQSHNIVAGSIRMVYALIYTLFLGYGIMIGSVLYGAIDGNATSETTCKDPLRYEWNFMFVPLFAFCLCVINQAHWRQMPLMITIAFCGYLVNYYSSQYFVQNVQVSNTLGALTIGVFANLYSRLGRHWERVMRWAWKKGFKMHNRYFPPTDAEKKRTFSFAPRQRVPDLEMQNPFGPPEERNLRQPSMPFRTDSDSSIRPSRSWKVAYGLAAAAMLPAIFVQVPSGLAAGGSLLAGVTSADSLTDRPSGSEGGGGSPVDAMNSVNTGAFNVLYSVIQVAIGISVGLFLSALIVYPFGKRRSGLFSF